MPPDDTNAVPATKIPFTVLAHTDEDILSQQTFLAVDAKSAENKVIKELVLANKDVDLDNLKIVVRPF